MIRQVVFLLLLTTALAASPGGQAPKGVPLPPADIPFDRLTADAVVAVALEPGSIESTDGVWIPNRNAGTIVRIDAKENKAGTPIVVGATPCASLVVAFDSVWVPLCGDGTLARVDPKTSKITATLRTKLADPEGASPPASAASGRSLIAKVWCPGSIRQRMPPVAEIYVAGGAVRRGLCGRCAVGHERDRRSPDPRQPAQQ